MEAEDYNFDNPNNPFPRNMITTSWDGDWESSKQNVEATVVCQYLNRLNVKGKGKSSPLICSFSSPQTSDLLRIENRTEIDFLILGNLSLVTYH